MKFQTNLSKITMILVLSFLLSACANKNPVFEEKPPDNTLNNQVEISTADDSLPESDNHSVETEPQLNDCFVKIGDVSLSLSESRQDILAKLEDAGFDYSERKPDYPDEANYDFFYNAAGCLQIYFLDDTCVRIRLQKFDSLVCNPQTARGLHPRDTYSRMTLPFNIKLHFLLIHYRVRISTTIFARPR